jgi:phage tail sheath protein FI
MPEEDPVDDRPVAPPPVKGLETAATVFIGRAEKGPLNKPVQCLGHEAFEDAFCEVGPHFDLARAVSLFFVNGGRKCHVVRVASREDPSAAPRPRDYRDALDALTIELPEFNLMAIPHDPGVDNATRREIHRQASKYCRERRAFLLVDAPPEWAGLVDVQDTWSDLGVARQREGLALESSAMYYPRVLVEEDGQEVPVGPSGAIAGLIARFDRKKGMWTPPAGREASILGISRLEHETTEDDATKFANEGVCVLRTLPEAIVSWGARTMAGHTSSWWKFIPVRRLAIWVERSIRSGTTWVETWPNDPLLWTALQRNLDDFMKKLWKVGALEGKRKGEAYFVRCDETTTTKNMIALNLVMFHVGFAPVRPEEFMVLEFTQPCGRTR